MGLRSVIPIGDSSDMHWESQQKIQNLALEIPQYPAAKVQTVQAQRRLENAFAIASAWDAGRGIA